VELDDATGMLKPGLPVTVRVKSPDSGLRTADEARP